MNIEGAGPHWRAGEIGVVGEGSYNSDGPLVFFGLPPRAKGVDAAISSV